MVNDDLLNKARELALVIGRRVQLTIPSILAEGETFGHEPAAT